MGHSRPRRSLACSSRPGPTANDVLETVGLLASLGVVLAFLVIVVYSKHLHIFLAPFNVAFSRRPRALGALLPVYSGGKPVDFEDPGEDDKIGRGAIEDFTWKGHAGLRDLHRVRSLPVAVPGLEHRQAAEPEAADHEPA